MTFSTSVVVLLTWITSIQKECITGKNAEIKNLNIFSKLFMRGSWAEGIKKIRGIKKAIFLATGFG